VRYKPSIIIIIVHSLPVRGHSVKATTKAAIYFVFEDCRTSVSGSVESAIARSWVRLSVESLSAGHYLDG